MNNYADNDTLLSLFALEETERAIEVARIEAELYPTPELLKSFQRAYRAYEKAWNASQKNQALAKTQSKAYEILGRELVISKSGAVIPSIENYCTILRHDPTFTGQLRKNEMGAVLERHYQNGSIRRWSNEDDARALSYIQSQYNLYDVTQYRLALSIIFEENTYNPIKAIIETIEWDGEPHISKLFSKWLKVADTPYNAECARLIFAGGINRLYRPGCKFDEVIVFQGVQGSGKSTMIRWLAINDAFFTTMRDFEGKDALEQLNGAFVVEIEEMAALKYAKNREAMKAFLSRQADNYRAAYAYRVDNISRTCIFIGTTNEMSVVNDKTGARRFYPVKIGLSRKDSFSLVDNEAAIRADILQCWAEALHLFREGKLYPVVDRELLKEVEEQQEQIIEEDPNEAVVEKYCEGKPYVVVREITENVFNDDTSTKTARYVGEILRKLGWWTDRKRMTAQSDKYGRQVKWFPPEGANAPEDLPF